MKKRTITYIALLLSIGSIAWVLPGGNQVSEEDLTTVYAQWFESPYEYMFDRGGEPSVEINGKSFARYEAGVDGILLYGSLAECADSYAERKGFSGPSAGSRSFYDISGIERMSGLQVLKEDEKGFVSRPVTADIVEWGVENLIPNPKTELSGVRFQEIYNVVFSRWFRMLAATYRHLETEYSMVELTNEYYIAITQNGYDGIEWLNYKFSGLLPEYDLEEDGTVQTVPMTFGFWLRRQYDGSRVACWSALSTLMKKYDKKWFKSLLK